MTARLLITGSRAWPTPDTVRHELTLAALELNDPVLVHGGARGVDSIAADWWTRRLKLPVECHLAEWGHYGKRAGMIRNQQMVDLGADLCLAFIYNDSAGATACAQMAERAGITVRYFRLP